MNPNQVTFSRPAAYRLRVRPIEGALVRGLRAEEPLHHRRVPLLRRGVERGPPFAGGARRAEARRYARSVLKFPADEADEIAAAATLPAESGPERPGPLAVDEAGDVAVY